MSGSVIPARNGLDLIRAEPLLLGLTMGSVCSSLLMSLLVLAGSTPALAALGRAPQTPEQVPQTVLRQAVPAVSLYALHQTALATGTVVREFVTPAGLVFALSWTGPVLPDLAVFFGDYHAAFQEAARQRRAAGMRGGALVLQQTSLVLVSRGRMGNFDGYAYVPALVPAGVVIDTLLQ